MRRRTLVTALGTGAISLSGCLSRGPGGEGDENGNGTDTPENTDPPEEPKDRRYEECSQEVIPYEQFPADVQTEIDAALEGPYAADRVYLSEAMDTEASYVSVSGTYYDPSVTDDDGGERLRLEAVEPKSLPDPRPVSVEHDLEGERTVGLAVVTEGGETLIEETRTLRPTATVEFGETTRVGTHEVRVTVEDPEPIEAELTGEIQIDESHFEWIVIVDSEGMSLTGSVAELGVCQYD